MEKKRGYTLVRHRNVTPVYNLTLIDIYNRPAIPGDVKEGEWFIEDNWEDEDPLWRAALNVSISIKK